ncbi:protein kinase domain-containing protein [Microbulbifer sp. ZKSA006]|uniref:protein kinase domain-containing protein n=1 Tax=Microbulbifer sp. ZKSA006 TaxID=3243390 RepID=UPI004039E9A1
MTSEQLPFYIGRYKVIGHLGSGGMGIVFLARDEQLNRPVAIKRLLCNSKNASTSQRIRQEALLLAQLNHSNIVQVYDVVECEGNMALVMEYVEGRSLGIWSREFNPNLYQKIQLLRQISAGLASAHRAGIIHRDLKADNILVDGNNIAKIADFGIAKNWIDPHDLTREEQISGSCCAMSPEQAQGKTLDNRSDLFAFGMLAYTLLCGQPPFGSHESVFVIVDRIINSPHLPAKRLNPELPAAISKLLDKLLAKKPEKRPISASAVSEELGCLLAQLSPQQLPSETCATTVTTEELHLYQKRKSRARNLIVGASLAVCIVALTAISFAFHRLTLSPPTEQKSQYIGIIEPNFSSLQSKEEQLLASNLMGAVKQDLSRRAGLLLVPTDESALLGNTSLKEQARALDAQLLLKASLTCQQLLCDASLELIDTERLAVIASQNTQLELNSPLESRARIMQQLNFLMPSHPSKGQHSRNKISQRDYAAYLQVMEQRHNEANVSKHIQTVERLLGKNAYFAPYYELLCDLVMIQQYHYRVTDSLDRFKELLDKVPSEISEDPSILIAQMRLAIYLADASRIEHLLNKLQFSLPDQAHYYYLRASANLRLEQYQPALQAIDRALQLRTSPTYLRQKARILSQIGDMEGAKPYLLQAIALNKNYTDAVSLLAANELDQGNPKATIQWLGKLGIENLGTQDTFNLCLAFYIEHLLTDSSECLNQVVEESPQDTDAFLLLAEIARTQNDHPRAQKLAQHALKLTDKQTDWSGLLLRAKAHTELGHHDLAMESLLKVKRSAPDNIYVNFTQAQIYLASGDTFSAKAHIRKALKLGLHPVWFTTTGFEDLCMSPEFSDLRYSHPLLCSSRLDT